MYGAGVQGMWVRRRRAYIDFNCVVIDVDPMFVVCTYAKPLGTYLRRARVYRRIMLIGPKFILNWAYIYAKKLPQDPL
jgi:hypothetical protein